MAKSRATRLTPVADPEVVSLWKDALVLEYAVFGQMLHLYVYYVNPAARAQTGHAQTWFFDLYNALLIVAAALVVMSSLIQSRGSETAIRLLRARIFLDIVLVVSSIAFRLSLTETSLHITEWLVAKIPYLQTLGVALLKKFMDASFSAIAGGIVWEWFRRRLRRIRRAQRRAESPIDPST